MCKFIFYTINNVLNENIIIFCFVIIILSLKDRMLRINIKNKLLELKKKTKC